MKSYSDETVSPSEFKGLQQDTNLKHADHQAQLFNVKVALAVLAVIMLVDTALIVYRFF